MKAGAPGGHPPSTLTLGGCARGHPPLPTAPREEGGRLALELPLSLRSTPSVSQASLSTSNTLGSPHRGGPPSADAWPLPLGEVATQQCRCARGSPPQHFDRQRPRGFRRAVAGAGSVRGPRGPQSRGPRGGRQSPLPSKREGTFFFSPP